MTYKTTVKLDFGKYYGKEITDVPTDYLEWLVKRLPGGPITMTLILEARHEINRRKGGNK